MENHTIHSFKFDLLQLSKQPHGKVEDRIIRIVNQSCTTILQRMAERFASERELILDRVALDLGGIPQEELEQQVPLRLERALKNYFEQEEKTRTNSHQEKEQQRKQHPLVYYLFYGVYPWYAKDKEPFRSAWPKHIDQTTFVHHILSFNWPQHAIQRFVQMAYSDLLEKTLQKVVPEQASFILNYHKELLYQQEQGRIVQETSSRNFHYVIWEFTFQYIFNGKGSRFQKKQFVQSQLERLAAHYNFLFKDFMTLILEGFRQLNTQSQDQKELYLILQELSQAHQRQTIKKEEEEELKVWNIRDVEKIILRRDLSVLEQEKLRAWLLTGEHLEQMKQLWLNPIREEWLYAAIEIMVGTESKNLIKEYHETLWEQQDQVTGTTMSAYQKAVWRFTLDFFAQSFSSYFQATAFVKYHSRKMAQHFNFSYQVFLKALVRAVQLLEESNQKIGLLSRVLVSIFEEESEVIENSEEESLKLYLHRMNIAFKNTIFYSEHEKYLFFESWAAEVLERTGVDSRLPLSQLLTLLKTHGVVHGSMIEQIKQYQAYEVEYNHEEKNSQFKEILSWADRFIDWRTEKTLQRWIKGEKEIDSSLLVRLLSHEKQLPFFIVEKLRASLPREHFQNLQSAYGVEKLNHTQFHQLLRLLFAPSNELLEIYDLLSSALPKQTKALRMFFLSFNFSKEMLNGKGLMTIWGRVVSALSKELKMKKTVLEQRVLETLLEQLPTKPKVLAHYIEWMQQKQYFGISWRMSASATPKEQDLKQFILLSNTGKFIPSKEEQNIWNTYFYQKLTVNPLEWIRFYFLNEAFQNAFEKGRKWFSKEINQLYLLRKRQWEKINQTIKKVEWDTGKYDRWITFFFEFQESSDISSTRFSNWEKEEFVELKKLLRKKHYLSQWVRVNSTVKKALVKQLVNTNSSFFFNYYVDLEIIYRQLPQQNRPYAYLEFELLFWQFLSTLWSQNQSDWYLFQQWIIFIDKRLKVSASFFVSPSFVIPQQHQQQWEQLLQREQYTKKLVEEELELEEKEKIEEDVPFLSESKWELENTGVVILHPFLKQLMNSLKLLNHEHQFSDETTRAKGIYLLHYLATGRKKGEDTIEEYELAFPKLICGLPVSNVVHHSVSFDKEDFEMADGLLKACIQHWDKLKGSSIDSLRNTFLIRRGRMEEVEDAFQLHVEKSGTDVLLGYLPWSISLIRFPWLEQPIYVSWR